MIDLESQCLRRTLHTVSGPQDTWITIDNKWRLNLSSNNYLGLADHPLVVEACQNALSECGAGMGASRLISGNHELHTQLEKRLAQFKQCEDAIVFSTGYMANLGVLTALMGKEDLIILDKLNHASLIDAARATGATLRVYQHADVNKLRSILEKCEPHDYARKMIVTDGVFSVDGDIAPLPEIHEAAREHGAVVLVDDAHATGVLGEGGRGTIEHFKLDATAFIHVGTLSKAFGALGGFVCGSKTLIEYLRNRARTFIYTTGLPAGIAAGALAAVELIETNRGLRQRLSENVKNFTEGLRKMRIAAPQSETPIIPILIGEAEKAVEIATKLFEAGVYCPALRPPTVPNGAARLRVSLMATHTDEDIDLALEMIAKVVSS